MKPIKKLLTLILAAASLAFVGSAKAQLMTYETLSSWSGNVITFNSNGATMGQTFSNVTAISSMTYTFVSASNASAAGTLQATFGEWNGSSFVNGTTTDMGIINVPSSSTWATDPNGATLVRNATTYYAFNSTLSFNSLYLTNPSKTYAMMLTNTSGGATSFGLGLVLPDSGFSYGSGYPFSGVGDWAFSQIVLTPADLTPVPESSTVAAIFGTTLVAGLAGFRARQRRKNAAAAATLPVAAA